MTQPFSIRSINAEKVRDVIDNSGLEQHELIELRIKEAHGFLIPNKDRITRSLFAHVRVPGHQVQGQTELVFAFGIDEIELS